MTLAVYLLRCEGRPLVERIAADRKGLVVNVGQTLTVDFSLKVATVAETIVVTVNVCSALAWAAPNINANVIQIMNLILNPPWKHPNHGHLARLPVVLLLR
jgi:hypothetical protein